MALAQPINAHVAAHVEARFLHEQQREQPSEATRPLAEGLDAHHVHREDGIIMSLRLAAEGDPTDAKFQELRLQWVV